MRAGGHGRFTTRRTRPGQLSILALVVAVLVVVAAMHWMTLPYLPEGRLLSIGGLAEIAIWLLLFSLLVAVHLRALPPMIYSLLTLGLAIWLVSQTADLMDEFLRQPLWISTFGEDIARVAGMLVVTLGVIALIRHSEATMHELQRLSFHDSLTGLGNRRMLQRVTEEFGDARYSLLLLDLDHFKSINDRFGHDVGDRVLQEIASLLQGRYGDRGKVFRLGGEEFAVVVDPADDEPLEREADRLRREVRRLREETDAGVTISVGAGTRHPAERPGDLMRRVDRALYRAKDAGRNTVMLAD